MSSKKSSADISAEHHSYHLYNLDDGRTHFPFELEANAIHYITMGDEEGALSCFEQYVNKRGADWDAGTYANNPHKQAEYTAVIAVSMFCRAAISGGLDPMIAYDRNDLYLIRVSEAEDEAEYWAIIMEALHDLCKLICENQRRSIQSLHVKRCRQYVYQHLNQRLTVKEIAEALGLNVSYLSGLFREHEGVTLKDYITGEKLKAAEHMLRSSDAEIGEIADMLAFSSASHLCEVFKRQHGITPAAFRNRYRHVDFRAEGSKGR